MLQTKVKLLCACPSLGTWDADTAVCFANAFATLATGLPKGSELGIQNPRSSDLVMSRTTIAQHALAEGYDWIWWFDSDMTFPPDAPLRLLAHDLPIVAAVGVVKQMEYRTQAIINHSNFPARDHDGLQRVDAAGFGCMLTSTQVLRDVAKPLPEAMAYPGTSGGRVTGLSSQGHAGAPLFGGRWKDGRWSFEDVFFCDAAKAAGYEIFVDCDLSKEIGHCGRCEYRHDGVRVLR